MALLYEATHQVSVDILATWILAEDATGDVDALRRWAEIPGRNIV